MYLLKLTHVTYSTAPPNSRTTARQKLTRLTIQQFHELSTDVYDELVRRQKDAESQCFFFSLTLPLPDNCTAAAHLISIALTSPLSARQRGVPPET